MSEKLARHPLAWGMTRWGPLPDTEDLFLFWGGPGSGICLEYGQDGPQQPVRHPSASGTYATVKEAQRAVEAFTRACV
jgi:hypothetical protein